MKLFYSLLSLFSIFAFFSCSSVQSDKIVHRSSAGSLSCNSAFSEGEFDFLETLNSEELPTSLYGTLNRSPSLNAEELDRSPAQSSGQCVIRVNYACSAKENDSCLDKNYCQKVKNWCYAYTKESGRKFDSVEEIRAKYKQHPEAFAKNTKLSVFINDWQRCKAGIYSRAYANSDKDSKKGKDIGGSGNDVKKKIVTGDQIYGTIKDPNSVGRPFCMNQTDDGKPVLSDIASYKTSSKNNSNQECSVTAKEMYDLWSSQISARVGRSLKKFDPWAPQGVEPWQAEKGLAYWKECAESKLTFDVVPSVDALVNYVNKQSPKTPIKRSDLIDDNFPNGDELAQKAAANDPTKYKISCALLEGKACLNARPKLRVGVTKLEGEDDANAIYRILKSATGAPDKLTFISDDSARDNTMTGYVSGTSFGFDGEVGKKVGVDRADYLKTCGSTDPNEFKNMIQTYRDTQENIAIGVEITSTIVLAALTGGLSVEATLGARMAVLVETQAVRALTVAEAAELSQLVVTAGRITFASEVLWFGGGSGVKTYNETGSMTAAAESLVINVAMLGAFRGASKLMGKGISKAAQSKVAQDMLTKAQRFVPQAEGKGLVPLTYKGLTKVVTELAPHVPAATLVFVTSCALDKKCDWNTVVKALGITASGIISSKIAQGMFPALKARFTNAPNSGKATNREPTVEDYKALNLNPKDLDGKTAAEAEKIISRAFRKVVVDTKVHPDVLIGGKASAAEIELAAAKFRKLAEIKELLILKYSNSTSAAAPVAESPSANQTPARDFTGFDKVAKYEKQVVESRQSTRTDREFLEYRRDLVKQQTREMNNTVMNKNLKSSEVAKINKAIGENQSELTQIQRQIDALATVKNGDSASGKLLGAAPSGVETALKQDGLDTSMIQTIMKSENSVFAKNLERNPNIKKIFVDMIKTSENSTQLQKDVIKFLDPKNPSRAQFMNRMLEEINKQPIDILKQPVVERTKKVIKSDCDAS